jgi:hypothetical protein
MRVLAAVLMAASATGAVKVGDPAATIALDEIIAARPVASVTLEALKGKAMVLEFGPPGAGHAWKRFHISTDSPPSLPSGRLCSCP